MLIKIKMVSPHELKEKITMPIKRRGRTVYDGGGILPDVQLDETKSSVIATALEKKSNAFFLCNSPVTITKLTLGKYPFSAADYQDFKQFIKALICRTEQTGFKNTLTTKRKVDESITEYQQLLTALNETIRHKTSKEIKTSL
jgi:carboxyl-terminal processing protease